MINEEEVTLRLGPPFPKQLEFLTLERRRMGKYGLDVSQSHWVGGRGTAKTTTGILLLCKAVADMPGLSGYWSEPTHGDIERIFITALNRHVPKCLWKQTSKDGFKKIIWYNGHVTDLLSREINNPKKEIGLGGNYCYGIDDEAANGFDKLKISQMHNAIREPQAPYLFHDTLSTPRKGQYLAWRSQKGSRTIRSCSFDNPYISIDVINTMIASMSPEMVRQEIYGDDVDLAGRVWTNFKEAQWPAGNIMEGMKYDYSKPFYLSCDLGGAQSAFQIIQHVDPVVDGRRMFSGKLAVVVAELCPNRMGLPAVVDEIVQHYCGGYDDNRRPRKKPVKVFVGHDISNPGNVMPGSQIFQSLGWDYEIPAGHYMGKDVQRQSASALIYNNAGHRRFAVAANMDANGQYEIARQHFGAGKTRGILNVMRSDEYPEASSKEIFRKDKGKLGENALEDDRDAFLYWVVCLHPMPLGLGSYMGNES